MTQEFRTWDPLDESNLGPEIISTSIKKNIKNILKSYQGWYDPFSELIQNALDALDKRTSTGPTGYQPRLWIKIDLDNNIIAITDNGIGFNRDEFLNFLAPHVSFKLGRTRGNKGVGATYLAYGFNNMQIATKSPGFTCSGVIKGGREWVEDSTNTLTRPKVQEINLHDLLAEQFSSIDQGSSFVLKLEGEHVRPKNLGYFGATSINQWEAILRIKTPLGGIYLNRDYRGPKCYLKVIYHGESQEKEIENLEYIYPHTIFSPCKSLREITEEQQRLLASGRDASRFPAQFLNLNGIFQIWNTQDIIEKKYGLTYSITDEEEELIRNHQVVMYSFQGFSTQLWKHYNDNVLNLRRGKDKIIQGGLQLSTNSMPQGEPRIIPLTKNIGLQNVTHVVIHFEGIDPDLGRKGFQPELEILADNLAASTVKVIRHWKKLLRADTGAPPDIEATREIHDWIREQEDHEREHPLIINRQDVFLPIREISLASIPCNEQDVISLFNQLLAGGVIRGIKILSSHPSKKYDGVFRYRIKEPFQNHIFNIESNPLGLEESKAVREIESSPSILEYKYDIDSLLDEFERGEKNQNDIKLVIAWDIGNDWKKKYEVRPLLFLENLHHRNFHGLTHIFFDASSRN